MLAGKQTDSLVSLVGLVGLVSLVSLVSLSVYPRLAYVGLARAKHCRGIVRADTQKYRSLSPSVSDLNGLGMEELMQQLLALITPKKRWSVPRLR